MPASYFRYPDLHADLITFVAANDVWLAPIAEGGGPSRAWRLTSDEAPVQSPRFSPDGTHIAWVSTRDGHPEVMVVALDGGEPQRLTYWGSPVTKLLGWTADGRVLVASTAGEANIRLAFVRAVGLDGSVERLPYGPVGGVAIHPSGAVAVTTPGSREPAAWKRYRGGTAARLWLDRSGDGSDWQRLLPEATAGLVSPAWVGDRLIFASDLEAEFPAAADGQANLYSLGLDGAELIKHTAHTPAVGYLRDPVTDGERIVYHARGSLYLLESLQVESPQAEPRRLEINLGSAVTGRRPRQLSPTENLSAVRVDHGGNGSVVEWRGNAFYLSHREGPARALAADSAVRVREPHLLGDTGQAILVSDAGGEDRLEIHSVTGADAPRIIEAELGRVLHLQSNPAGDAVAAISHDGRISHVDLGTGAVRELGRSLEGEATGLTFAPDGRYLVWTEPLQQHSKLILIDVTDPAAQPVALTSGRFRDFAPDFSADGKYLAFLSVRTFDPTYDTHVFNLMFASGTRPYLIPLSATEPAPFGPSSEGWRLSEDDADESKGKSDDAASAAPVSVTVDLDGFEERIVPFPVPAGNYRDLRCTEKGVLWVHEAPVSGVLGSSRAGVDGEDPGDALEFYNFKGRKLETLLDKVDSFDVSGDGHRVVARVDDAVLVLPSDHKVKDDDPARVEVDLDRLRFELDPVAEWTQMFDENVRIMRDHYWREDMNGVDWAGVADRYRPLVAGLACHDDLVDLLWETVGELNTSHAYVMPSDPPGDQSRRLGLLGADLAPTADGSWEITRILPGESSDPAARSPLRAAGVGVAVGDRITAVDGLPVDPRFGPAAALIGAADKPVELTVRPADGGQDRRTVVVPLDNEEAVRYQGWVASRAAYVRRASVGRLGYLHIPDMMSPGWAQIHRDLDLAMRSEGVIVDVRYNRGGHLSQLVVERLSRKVLGWNTGRHYATWEEYPAQSARGPLIFLANEWSGSDGDIVNAAVQALGLGPVIGLRTWGGVVGIDGRFDLVDGTSITQPRYSFWLQGYEWGVENHGIDPDIEVPMTPAQWHQEADVQLDRGIAEALQRLDQQPATQPPGLPVPRVAQR